MRCVDTLVEETASLHSLVSCLLFLNLVFSPLFHRQYRAMAGLHTSLSSSLMGGDLSSSSSSSVSAPSSSSPSYDINGLGQPRQERILLLPCGPLLDMLWEGTRSGSPVVQQVYRQLLDACAHVFIFQVGCLMGAFKKSRQFERDSTFLLFT